MIITHANVEDYAKQNGLEPLQIDGIPEGFSFIEPDVTIGGVDYSGMLVVFVPLKEWNDGVIRTKSLSELLDLYLKKKNGK